MRDGNWWGENAAKALAVTAEAKQRGTSSISSNTASNRPPRRTNSCSPHGESGRPQPDGGLQQPQQQQQGQGDEATTTSPAFSTISSREQAERDRERLDGGEGYRRPGWGVTDTPGYGTATDDGRSGGSTSRYAGSRRKNLRRSSSGYQSRESSGWGLTSDDGMGDGSYVQQITHGGRIATRRTSVTSSVTSGGGSMGENPDNPKERAIRSSITSSVTSGDHGRGSYGRRGSGSGGIAAVARKGRARSFSTPGYSSGYSWSEGMRTPPPPSSDGSRTNLSGGTATSGSRRSYPPPSRTSSESSLNSMSTGYESSTLEKTVKGMGQSVQGEEAEGAKVSASSAWPPPSPAGELDEDIGGLRNSGTGAKVKAESDAPRQVLNYDKDNTHSQALVPVDIFTLAL